MQIYYNTVLNWKAIDVSLGRQVKTIMYVTNTSVHHHLATFARGHGWLVFEAPRVSSSGVPFLKEMYRHASQHFNSCIFYGFSNGDILYNRDLLVTLNAISMVTGSSYNRDQSTVWNLCNNYRLLNLLCRGFEQEQVRVVIKWRCVVVCVCVCVRVCMCVCVCRNLTAMIVGSCVKYWLENWIYWQNDAWLFLSVPTLKHISQILKLCPSYTYIIEELSVCLYVSVPNTLSKHISYFARRHE